MGLIQKAFSDIITFSRASNATRIGPNGLVQYAPHNLILQSQTFDNASWIKYDTSVTANTVSAPDGTVTADLIIPNTTNTFHAFEQSITSGAQYTFSIYAKASGYSYFAISNSGATGLSSIFDLSSGTVVNGASVTDSSITSVGNGWYRCTMTITPTFGGFTVYFSSSASSITSFAGNGTSGIQFWGAQTARGPYPLDYTPTTSAAVYGSRFDFDPVTLAAKGLLIEEQRTNLLTYSEQFDNAAWGTASNVTVTANSTVAPDGTTTADTVTEVATNATHRLEYITSGTSVATQYTVSFYVKVASGSPWFRLSLTDSTGNHQLNAWFDLTNGVTGSTSVVGSGVIASRSITSVGNGWYRCVMTGTVTGGAGVVYSYTGLANADLGISYLGSTSRAVHLWGAQLEAGSFATSYIPTIASTVTRSADVATVNTLSPWFNATEGTIYTEFDIIGKTSTFGMVSQIDDGSLNNRIVNIGQEAASGNVRTGAFINQSGVSQMGEYPITSMTVGSVYKNALAFAANNCAVTVNGLSIVDGSVALPTGLTTARLGNRISDGYLNGHLRRFAFYPRRLSDSELTTLTA